MKDILSISRLSLLIKNHVVENRQRYILYAFGILAIGFMVYIFLFSINSFHAYYYRIENGVVQNPKQSTNWEEIQFFTYLSGLYIFGGIFACISFVNFSNSAEAIFYLNKPASHLEKWLTEIVVRIIFLFLTYTLLFYIIDIPATMLVRGIEHNSYLTDLQNDVNVIKEVGVEKLFHPSKIFCFYLPDVPDLIVYVLFVSIYLSVVGFFMYGSVLFNRFSFFKTLFLGFIIGMLYFFYGLGFADTDALMPGTWDYRFPDRAIMEESIITNGVYDEYSGYRTKLDPGFLLAVSYFLLIIVPVFLLACSYFKLKEKEV
jgi:hypothetical protein